VTQKERSGFSKITSVSVSKEMLKIIELYNLSPTEVFRRGIGVTLHDLGIKPYNISSLNHERSEYVKEFIKNLEEQEKLEEFNNKLEIIKKFNNAKSRIKKALINADRAISEIGSFQ